ncbi:ABC transporter permease [Microbacterium sp. A93]|uniref:ABC transporter permease n=1 Tax=Microbacterium sp. A93 TaxID=3450716 RepID=UPI003F4211B4
MTEARPVPPGPAVPPAPALPLDPAASAARVRRFGAWFYAEHYLQNMRRYGGVILVSAIGEPLVYLLAMGMGLASLIGGDASAGAGAADGTGGVGGVGYLAFIAPALLAAGTLMAASTEFTYPVMDGFKWHRLYFGPQASPIAPHQIAAGHITAVLLRYLVQSVLFFLIMLAFGAVSSPWGWLQVLSACLGGLAVGLPLMAFAATLRRDAGQFALVQRFVIMPLFLFSATFYPLSALPIGLQWIGWISPQWHAAQLGRIASYGMENPAWLTAVHVGYLLGLAILGWILVRRIYTRRLGWVPGSADRDAVVRPGKGHTTARRRPARAAATAPGAVVTGSRPADVVPAMPELTVRTGPGAGMYAGRIRVVVERGLQALKTSNWAIFVSGFVEPVLYLLSLGIGLGSLVGDVAGPAGPVSYGEYIAPALLAVSAMNGAIYDSTWNVFFKMRMSRLYETMLNTSLGPVDIALGEITLALMRGGLYSAAFLVVMSALGLVTSWWALLLVPAALMIAFAFASVGMAVTSYMTKFQQMDWIMVVLMPMFLFSATFFPLSVYPDPVQWVIQVLPLWHGVELLRQLGAGVFTGWTGVHVLYFAVMICGGLIFTSHRLKALFLR